MTSRPTLEPTADGFDTLYSPAYDQTFHSKHGALTEARHVFLQGTGVDARLAGGLATRVLEVGFGTGLNSLLTARQAAATQAPLHYVALEITVLPADVLARLNHGPLLGAQDLRQDLLDRRRRLPDVVPPGRYLHSFSETLRLDLVVGNATEVRVPDLAYDAVYFDAFSPDANPELWTASFLARLYAVMRAGGTLATYSAVGFRVARRPGPPGKREMLVACR